MKRANIVTYDVYVSNFNKTQPNDLIEKKISKHFTQFGETRDIFVRENNNQGKYAVVKYLSEPDADRAVSDSNGFLLDGLPILVRRMERKPKMDSTKLPGSGAIGGGMVVTGGTWTASKDSASKTQLGKNPDIVPAVEPTGSASPGPEGETSTPAPMWNRLPGSVMMLVTFVETPTLYWCQDLSDAVQQEVENVRSSLAEVCPTAPTLTSRPEPGKLYGGKFSEDGEWYRCQLRIVNSSNPDKLKIQYVDYGNCEDVWWKELVELPADLAGFKPYAQKIMLHNTRYVGGKDREAKQYLENLLSSQHCTVCPTFRLPDGTGLFAQVYTDTTGNLNQHLIDLGYATVKPPKQQQQQPQPPLAVQQLQQQNEATSPQSFHLGDGGGYGGMGVDSGGFQDNMGMGINRGQNGMGNMQGRQVLGEGDPMRNNAPSWGHVGRFGSPKPGDKGSVLGDVPSGKGAPLLGAGSQNPAYSDLRIELMNKQRVLDQAREELVAERLKIKSLQNDFQGLVTRMEENNIVNQLKILVGMVKKVKQLRSQFRWDEPTALDEALDLVNSDKKVTDESITSLSPLMATLNTYRTLQQEISCMDNTQGDSEKLKERDDLRKTLHQQLCDCLTEMEGTPFTERANSITQCTEKLLQNYEGYFNMPVDACPDLQDAIDQYLELKAKKQNDFEQTQLQTDQQQQCVQTLMADISKGLSVSEDGAGDCDLDLIKQTKMFRMCLQQEIAIRNVEDSQEGSFLASLVKCVCGSLKREVLGLNKLTRLQKDFLSMRDTLGPWLDSPPSLDTLLDNRQTLRSLKSKLRHKLADKHDAEENDEKEDLEEIQKEVEAIQTEIHNALLVEEKELAELAVLVNEHFPEFHSLHPDSGVDLQLKYQGIVKSHHEISHYNLTPIPGANDSLFFSKFASKDIIVRECLLSDGHHLGQEDFLAQLMTYMDISHSHPGLLLPSTIFFDKKCRHAYVVVEKGEGDILANCVQYGTIGPEDGQSIVKSTVEAVSALHARKILHGEINPFSILRFPDGSAKLLPPDFSCSPTDRARNKQTVSGCLSFTAPELSSMPAGSEATGVVDMYSIGVLILYISCGSEGVPLTADGSLDVSKLQLEASACGVVKSLLSQQPAMRPTTDMVLVSPYLLRQSQDSPQPDCNTPPPVTSVMGGPVACFTPPPMQQRAIVGGSLPMMPPVNLHQPPPPLPPNHYGQPELPPFATTTAESLARFSTPPPVESFSALTVTDSQAFVDTTNPACHPATFSAPISGFEAPIGTFEAAVGAYSSVGFEEAAMQQEQMENESRGPMPSSQANSEAAFSMGGDQGQFEIGTFSIQDVNGSGDSAGAKGRKITRQLSAEDGEEEEEGEDWPADNTGGE